MGELKSLFKRCLVVAIVFDAYITLWALLFVYIEECLPEKEQYKMSEEEKQFMDFIKMVGNLTDSEIEKFANISSQYYQSKLQNTRECNYGVENLFKWWLFGIMTTTTIGFGRIVPRTALGKILTCMLSTFGIPCQVALLSIQGEIVNKFIIWVLTKIEVGYLKRPEVKNKAGKQFIATILMTAIVWILWAWYINIRKPHYPYTDCLYYVFQILTTVGYGDIDIVHMARTEDIASQAITAAIGMSTSASIVSSACSFLQKADAKKAILRVTSLTKKWSVNKTKVETQENKNTVELFRFHERKDNGGNNENA